MTTGKRILLVDDDAEFVAANKDLLEAHGYEVVTASDGPSGIEAAKTTCPNLMILDVMMATDTEGFDVSRRVHESPELKGLPVIMLTGIRRAMNLPFGFEPDAEWLPVKAVLEKPIQPEKLLAAIRNEIG
jgi:CheY-like chemotaxis protein